MVASPLSLAAFHRQSLLLSYVAIGAAAGRADVNDGAALVQVGVVTNSADSSHPADPWSRVQGFPLEADGFHFVGSAAFTLQWLEKKIHFSDIAFYLKSSSPLWRSSHRNHTKDIEDMLGQAKFYVALRSRMVSRKSLAALVDGLIFFADMRQLQNYSAVLDEYKRCYRSGPKLAAGSILVLTPDRKGLTLSLNGERFCRVESQILGKLVMDQYLGQHDFPELRNSVFAQLVEGKPSEVHLPMVISEESSVPWWVTMILVLLGLLGCAGLLYFYHSCCRPSYSGHSHDVDS